MESARFFGPYKHGNRWRVVVGSGSARVAQSFASFDLAQAAIAAGNAQTQAIRIGQAVVDYLASLRARNLKSSTISTARVHLATILDLRRTENQQLRLLTSQRASEAYHKLVNEGYAVDSHRNALAAAKAFGAWCVKAGHLKASPFDAVEGSGRRKRGKPQLRVNEARKLIAVCLDEASAESIAVACALLLGARASEIAQRTARDLDDDGRLLWIPDSKTLAGRRCLEIPELLQPHLLRIARGKGGTAPLFGDVDRHWVRHHCLRLCKIAGVPEVTPHGLRGTAATIATPNGAVSHQVAAALGHASTAITARAYVDRTSAAQATQRAALRVLVGGVR